MIRTMKREDIPACAMILCSVYNNDLWQCRWQVDTAAEYLEDIYNSPRFVGYVIEEDGSTLGGIFARERVWWNNIEVFVEELFIRPDCQRMGLGTVLLSAVEDHVRKKGLAGITLTTNRYAPAADFYRKNGFEESGHVVFLYREAKG